jgi:hypothetical protein
LNKDVERNAVLIHGAPKIVLHSVDANEHLIEAPLVPGPRSAETKAVGKGLAEFPAPTLHRLVGDDNASFGQKQFDITQAQAEYVIQPDGMADDLGWKAMAVMPFGRWLHAVSLLGLQPGRQTSFT